MDKVVVTCDSTADLNHLFEERDIKVIPLVVNLGTNSFLDGVTICPNDIYKYVAACGELPKTAARNEEDFYGFFKQFTDQGFEVVHVSISSGLSINVDVALKAAAKLKGVYIVDSKSLSTGVGLTALYACDLRDEGRSGKEIAELVRARTPAVQASFVLTTVEYLHKGGRCSGLSALMATTLMIKPTIVMENGKMHPGKKYFPCTYQRAVPKYVDDILEKFNTPDPKRVFITHTSASPEIVERVRETLKATGKFEQIIETVAGATITSHCGKGTLGILYYNDGSKAK